MTHQTLHSTFEDLEVYQVAREFRKAMYRVAKRLPDIEKFGLASQTRRAALSVTNIAEGHGRYHYLDQIKFTLQSRGSLEELIDDEQYLPVEEIASLKEQGWWVRQLIDGYIRYLRGQKNAKDSSSVRETSPVHEDDEIDCNSRFTI
ncbi:MAG: four helix bundle protein [Spartobacteria bacterium]|nr:four helix bundle protein [Spartobacteria bacterium]